MLVPQQANSLGESGKQTTPIRVAKRGGVNGQHAHLSGIARHTRTASCSEQAETTRYMFSCISARFPCWPAWTGCVASGRTRNPASCSRTGPPSGSIGLINEFREVVAAAQSPPLHGQAGFRLLAYPLTRHVSTRLSLTRRT